MKGRNAGIKIGELEMEAAISYLKGDMGILDVGRKLSLYGSMPYVVLLRAVKKMADEGSIRV